MLKKIGFVLVLLMALLQGFYGLFAYLDPTAFAGLRGTSLVSMEDMDWVLIYGSRTVFIALIIGVLLYARNYQALMWAAILGTVMPMTDGFLAYQAEAPFAVVAKHLATVVYLVITAFVLARVMAKEKGGQQ